MSTVGQIATLATWRRTASLSVSGLLAILAILVMVGLAKAGEPPEHVNVDPDGFSVNRYDPVAYFTEGRPVRGNPEIYGEYQGVKYAFSSESNRQLFLDDPEKYVPQYGGYCAYGLAQGAKSDVDPEVWDIVDGKLYLMVSGGTQSVWQKRKKAYIELANKAWRSIISQ